jgi:AcrR family transcriptional regulator
MTAGGFQRARSEQAKRQREQAILLAARELAKERGVRNVTLSDIAAAVGMHKSAMLRYFETREKIFLRLTGRGWQDWSQAVQLRLRRLEAGAGAASIARAISTTLVARPLFCDLLAQTPVNLENNVAVESVREFKLLATAEASAVASELRRLLPIDTRQAFDIIAAATSLAGEWSHLANNASPQLQALYRDDPRLAHAIVDVGPRLTRVLTALFEGYCSRS